MLNFYKIPRILLLLNFFKFESKAARYDTRKFFFIL